jgi:hypothetical protein
MAEKHDHLPGGPAPVARVEAQRLPAPPQPAAPAPIAAAAEAADLLAAQVPDEALAVGDPGAAPAHQAARLARVAPPVRRSLLGRLQQQRGNTYVQRVLRQLRTAQRGARGETPAVQRENLAGRIQAASAGGSPLAPELAQDFGDRLGADLSGVRVHTGPEADSLNQAVNAVAFTTGRDIFFSHGAYAPEAPEGQRLLAHELAHTIQQAAGPVGGRHAEGGVMVSDPHDAFEQAADTAARRAVAPGSQRAAPVGGHAPARPALIQRQPAPEAEAEPMPGLGAPDAIKLDDEGDGGTITIDEEGVTNCNYNPPALRTKDEKVTDVGDGLVDITGTIVGTFKATITVTLPTVPGGLSACQRKRVQDAIDKQLKPHEDQHVAAFKKYDGTYEAPCEARGVPRKDALKELVAAGKVLTDIEGARRKQEAQDASDALDKPPFVINVDLNCKDDKKSSTGEPGAGLGEGGEGEGAMPVQMVQRLPRGHLPGPLGGAGPPGASEVLARAEQALGFDLSAVSVNRDSPLPAAAGAEALTIGRSVHLSPGAAPSTPHGAHVLAHELAHVVQQGLGQAASLNPDRYAALEAEAEAQAQRIAGVPPVPASASAPRPLPAPARPAVQAFDPRYHRQSLVEGTQGTGFSPDEIGLMYAANWERDFSQAHPALGAVVLAWKAVKLAASAGTLTETELGAFEGAVGTVISMIPFRIGELKSGKAYGGYNYYEHMDNPTGAPGMDEATRQALLTPPAGESIPQYMVDSREYMKAQLFRAASLYRGDMSASSASGQTAAAFARRQEEVKALHEAETPDTTSVDASATVGQETAAQVRSTPVTSVSLPADTVTAPAPAAATAGSGGQGPSPAGAADLPTSGPVFHMEVDRRFWQQTNYKVGQRLDPALPEDKPYIATWTRIRDQVRAEREAQNAAAARDRAAAARPPNGNRPGAGGTGAAAAPVAAPAVARPGNFTPDVGDALGRASHALEDFFSHSNFVELAIGEMKPEQGLFTATFTEDDSTHSLAHKIRGLADEIEAEMPLVNRVAGRTEQNPDPSQVNVGNTAPPTQEHEDVEDIWDVVGEDAPKGAAIGAGVGGSLGATAGAALGAPLGPVGSAAGAFVGGGVGAFVGGAVGGFLGLEPEVQEAVLNVGGYTLGGALVGGVAGAIAGMLAFGPGGAMVGGFAGMLTGGVMGLRSGIGAMARNVLATPAGVGLLRRAAELLEESTREKAGPGSHTALAKDQPSHEDDAFGRLKTIKFHLAQELAAEADNRVIGPMRQVFDAATPDAADALLQAVYKALDGLIAAPGSGHALAPLIDRRREEAVNALTEYQAAAE